MPPAETTQPGILPALTRYVMGFTVLFAAGLSPYLGLAHVPGFTALLELIPDNLRNLAIPISAFAMGFVAVYVQMTALRHPKVAWIDTQFRWTSIATLAAVASLILVYTVAVVPLEIPAQQRTDYIQVGLVRPDRTDDQRCQPTMSDQDCIRYLSTDRAQIVAFWGKFNVLSAGLLLLLSYWLSLALMVWLVGLIILRQRKP